MTKPTLALVALLGLPASACEGGEVTNERPGEAQTAAVAPVAAPPPAAPRHEWPSSPSAAAPAAPTETIAVQQITPEPTDDLEARVRAAYGHPAECFSASALPPDVSRVSVTLSASVSMTGMITRADVGGSPLTPALRECLENRALRTSVAGGSPGGARTVTTRFEFELGQRTAAAAETRPPAERPLPPGAQQPASALPAVVGDGPAPGSVRADYALPAQGDDPREREGFVPASSTLPAQGPATP